MMDSLHVTPSCDDCNVTTVLYMGERWLCPVCEKEPAHGYKHLVERKVLDDSNIPLLRFLKGKCPNSPKPDK
jgi:hypothetical protein